MNVFEKTAILILRLAAFAIIVVSVTEFIEVLLLKWLKEPLPHELGIYVVGYTIWAIVGSLVFSLAGSLGQWFGRDLN